MENNGITIEIFNFLKQLFKNNNRDWFAAHKTEFKQHETSFKKFMIELKEQLLVHDDIEKLKVFRIYRDVRFSKNKAPYKTNFGGSFSRNGAKLRGGYYLQIEPGNNLIATGFWQPNKEDLLRIRKEFETDAKDIRKILDDENLKKYWGTLVGEELKTAPKGFDKEHEAIDLIKKKQYIFTKSFSDEEVLSIDFLNEVV